ncbi:MAG: BCD family MFS transporter [Candidatus Roseilinea sp.]|uniref:BCD family MFS transporter n=1 Tax=Candidatus Roseilinea sp. TaxID=2838777 RepID=UPI0040499027
MFINKRLLRLSLFQFGLGFSVVVFNGALNRVLIAEEDIPATVVGWLLSLSLWVAPVRVLMGAWSDREKRTFGFRRLPYIWYGMMMVFAGLSASPLTLWLLSRTSQFGPGHTPFTISVAVCTFIFFLYAIGSHIAQTAYLALVTDLTPKQDRSRAVAFLWMMLIIGQIVSALIVGVWLTDFSPFKLIQVMQTGAVVFMVFGLLAIYRQDRPVHLEEESEGSVKQLFALLSKPSNRLFFLIVFVGTLGLNAQDVLLEPYGGQVLGMSVTETTRLTALWGVGMLAAMLIAWRTVPRLASPLPVTLAGCLIGLAGFSLIATTSQLKSVPLFAFGAMIVGLAGGLFLISTLALVMGLADIRTAGLYVGLWGLMQTTAMGLGSIAGGAVRDLVAHAWGDVALGYVAVYAAEVVLLIVTFALLTAMPREAFVSRPAERSAFAGLTDIPG